MDSIDDFYKKGEKYLQTQDVRWLDTPKGTIWINLGYRNYIQPEDPKLRSTPLGVDLDLLFDDDEALFELIKK